MKFTRFGVYIFLVAFLFGCSGFMDEVSPPHNPPIKPSNIVGNESDYLHKGITINGKVLPGNAACTLIGCPPENPCCNSCSAPLFLVDVDATDISAGVEMRPYANIKEEFVCSGNECELSCAPMTTGKSYHIIASWQKDEQDKYYLQVYNYTDLIPGFNDF